MYYHRNPENTTQSKILFLFRNMRTKKVSNGHITSATGSKNRSNSSAADIGKKMKKNRKNVTTNMNQTLLQVRDPTLPQPRSKRKSVLTKGKNNANPPPYRQHFQMYRLKPHQSKTPYISNSLHIVQQNRRRPYHNKFQNIRDLPKDSFETSDKLKTSPDENEIPVIDNELNDEDEPKITDEELLHDVQNEFGNETNGDIAGAGTSGSGDVKQYHMDRIVNRRLTRMQQQAKRVSKRVLFEDVIQLPEEL